MKVGSGAVGWLLGWTEGGCSWQRQPRLPVPPPQPSPPCSPLAEGRVGGAGDPEAPGEAETDGVGGGQAGIHPSHHRLCHQRRRRRGPHHCGAGGERGRGCGVPQLTRTGGHAHPAPAAHAWNALGPAPGNGIPSIRTQQRAAPTSPGPQPERGAAGVGSTEQSHPAGALAPGVQVLCAWFTILGFKPNSFVFKRYAASARGVLGFCAWDTLQRSHPRPRPEALTPPQAGCAPCSPPFAAVKVPQWLGDGFSHRFSPRRRGGGQRCCRQQRDGDASAAPTFRSLPTTAEPRSRLSPASIPAALGTPKPPSANSPRV